MKIAENVRVKQVDFILTARPAPGVPMASFLEEMRDLHNPIVAVRDNDVVAVTESKRLLLDHSEAAEGEMVYACDGCGCYSKSKLIVLEHEQTCPPYLEIKGLPR